MFNERRFELSISVDYVKAWGMGEAVRELIQNAIDSDSPFEFEFIKDRLFIHSRFASLSPESLLLGSTSKEGKTDAIGSFGEGYKIALLVLARLGYGVVMHNKDVDWVPGFVMSRQFKTKMLCITERKAAVANEGLTVEIYGLTDDDISQIKERCTYMQKSVGGIKQTSKGKILLDQPGRLYVDGLFVCETQLQYGYDMKPQYLRLERDRRTVDSFDLAWTTSGMWGEIEDLDHVSEMIEGEVEDVKYISHSAPLMVKEACYNLFRKKNPGAVAVKNQAELDDCVERRMTNTVIVNDSYHSCITGSRSYKSSGVAVPAPTPHELLTTYFEKNKKYMRTPAIVAMKSLVKKSEKWRNKK